MLELAGFNLHVYPTGPGQRNSSRSSRVGTYMGTSSSEVKRTDLPLLPQRPVVLCSTKREISGVFRLSGIGWNDNFLSDLGPSSTFSRTHVPGFRCSESIFGKEVPTSYRSLNL